MLTCALRGAAIFGERDKTAIPGFINFYNAGRTNFQIGDNSNLFDWTYVGNHAHAHILAVSALLKAYNSPTSPPDDERVDGEVFYTTNDEPRIHFWDFPRKLYKAFADELGDEFESTPKVISQWQALVLAHVMDWAFWAVGRKSPLTPRSVYHCCRTAYFSNEKAKRRLGYRVRVPMDEAIRRTAKVCLCL
jgi:sterol-4alpha-carboxylate 3-dehydrogenase (decarboxylating)